MTNSDLEDEQFRAFNPIDISGQCPGQRENNNYDIKEFIIFFKALTN